MSSWRQYGGTNKTFITTVNAGAVVANNFLTRNTSANINQFDNLKVKGQLLSQDFIESGTYVKGMGQLITSGNLFVKQYAFFGTDASKVNLPWSYISGNSYGISINNQRPEAVFHVTGLSFEVLKIDSSLNYIRNIIGQNVNARGVVVAADDASSNIYFYNDVSTNILNKADSFIKNQPGSGLTIGSSSSSVISLDNQGNVLISAAGTLSLFSTTGKFNISSNSTTLQSYLIVTNRGTNYNAKYNESAIIYDNSNVTYLRNVYDVSSVLTGNSLSLLAIDNSSNTTLRIIDPSGSGLSIGGGAFPGDTKRSFGSLFLSDLSGSYILSQNIVSGNSFHKYATTTGINTFKPKTENYVLDINGPTRIGNGELKTVFNANFEFKQISFSKKMPNFGMAVGSASSTGIVVGSIVIYPQYFSYTTDTGKTWNTLPIDTNVNNFTQRPNNTFNSLYVYDTNFAIIGANDNTLYYTINGGNTWLRLSYNSNENSDVFYRNTTNIYVDEYNGIFRVFLSFDYTNNTNNTNNTPKYNTFDFSFNPYSSEDSIVSSGYIGYLTSDQAYNIQNYYSYTQDQVTGNIIYSNVGPNNYSYKINASDCSGRYIYLVGDGIIKVDASNSIPSTIYNRQNQYLSQYNDVYVYDNSNVIAVGNNILSWTKDGTNWTDRSLSEINIGNVNLQSVFIYDLYRAVAVGNNGVFIYTKSWQNSTWAIVPHELLNSSGIGSRIDGSNNQLQNIYMHSIDLFLISNVTIPYVPNSYNNTTITLAGNYGASRMLYAYYPNIYNRANNTLLEVSGNMFISGDLNINDGGKLMSNNDTFYLLNDNVQNLFIGNNRTNNNMSGSLFVGIDLSVNSRLFVVNDSFMNARLFIGADVSMNGNIYSSGRSIQQGDVSMNSRLFIGGDVSMNSRLFITSDVSMGLRLFVGGDASFGGNIYTLGNSIQHGDVSMNSRLSVNGDVTMNDRLFIDRDVSMNSRLFIGSDTNVGGNLTVQKDMNIIGRLNVMQYAQSSIIYTNVTTNNYTLIISEDMSLNGRLVVNYDVSINSRLFTGGDVSMNGNVYSFGRTIQEGDVSMNSRLFINGDVSMNSRLFVLNDASFGGNIYALGRTIQDGDVSMNSRLFVNGDVSMNSRLFVLNDASFGGNIYTLGHTINQGDVSMNSRLFVNGDVSMNSRLFITSDVSMGARLFVSTDVSFGGNMYAQGHTIVQGDVSMNSRLFIDGDVSMNSRLFVTSDVYSGARLFISDDVSFNSNLYTKFRSILDGDAVLNSRLFVANDVSMNNNVGITKNLTVYNTVYSAYYDICSNLYYNNPNYPDVANQPGVANSITIGNNASFINIGTGQGEVGSTRTITIGAGNQPSSNTANTIYLAGANDNLIISGKLSAQNFNLTTIAIPAFVFNSTQNNTTGTAAATNYGSSFSKIKENASSISSVANIADNVGWLGAGFGIQDASLSTAGFFTVDSSGSGFYMKAPASNNIVQLYTDSLKYGATNFGNRSNIRNGILVLTTDFSLNSPINGNPLVTYSITVKPIDISNIFLRDDLVTDPSFQRILTSVCVVGDVSMNSRMFLNTDASFGGNMYIRGRTIHQGDVSMNSRLFVNGDVSMNSRLFVTSDVSMRARLFVSTDVSFAGNIYSHGQTINQGDVSMNSRLFVNGDVSMNSRLFVTSDVSMGARLFVSTDASFGGNIYTGGRTVLQGDVSMNSRLFINGDVSMNARLFVLTDASFSGNMYTNGRSIIQGDVSMNSRLFIHGDVSMNSRLFVTSDVSFGSHLFIGGDVSMNSRLFVKTDASFGGNLYTGGRTVLQGDVSMNSRLFVNGDVSMNSRLFVTSDVSMGARLFVNTDASFGGNMYTLGSSIYQGDVSMNSRLFVNGDVSMNSRLFVTSDLSLGGRLFVGNDVIINGRLSVFEYQKSYVLYTNVTQTQYTLIVREDLSLNGRLNVNYDVSMNAHLFVSDDVSFGSNLYVFGRTILQDDVSMNSRLFVNGDVSMNSRLFVTSDVSMGARLFVLKDASFGGNMYINGCTVLQGDVSMNSRLFVTSDVSMGARLFVLKDASFGGNMYTGGRTVLQGDVSMNSRLFVNGDVSMNSRLFVTNDVSMGARLFVKTDASFGGNLYGFGRSILQGDVSMNSRLFIKGDVSMNNRLFVTSNALLNSNLFVTNDVSFGARLFVNTDASFGGNIYVNKSISVGVKGSPYQIDLSGDINLRGMVNPITLIDNSVLLTNTPPLDFSNNYGSVWNPVYKSDIYGETFNAVAMSATGQYQTVVTTNSLSFGYIYTSADYGFTWSKGDISNNWTAVAISATGQYLSATVYSGNIWTNTNYGYGSWTEYRDGVYNTLRQSPYTISTTKSTQYWLSIAMSASGKYQTAITNTFATTNTRDGDLYISSTYGNSWSLISGLLNDGSQAGPSGLPGNNAFSSIALSSTGQYQATVIYSNFIYISANYGNNWKAVTENGLPYLGISISSSGQYITAVTSSISLNSNGSTTFIGSTRGSIYRSSNYGETWINTNTNNYWNSVKMTASGQYQTAVVNNGMYTESLFTVTANSNQIQTNNHELYPAIVIGASVTGNGIPNGTVVTSILTDYNNGDQWQFYISNKATIGGLNVQLTFQSGAIYSSSNYGVSWYDNSIKNVNGVSNTMNQLWETVAISANGQYQTAIPAGAGGYIYTSATPYQQMLISNNLTVMSGDTAIYTRLFVMNDVSMTSRLFVTSDVSLNARLFVGRDASYNGNMYTLGRTILQGDVSMNSRLFVNGNVYLPSTSHVYIGDKEVGASNSTETTDTWTLTNLIGSPPAVVFTDLSNTSTNIIISWTYPTQINTGFVSYPLPLIQNLTITYRYKNNSGIFSSGNALTNATGTNYASTFPANSNGTAITAIVLTNNPTATTGYGTTRLTNGSTRYAYTFYDAGFVNMDLDTGNAADNSISLWYSNNSYISTNASITTFKIGTFVGSGTPGIVLSLSFITNSNVTNPITLDFQYYPPQYSDITNNLLTSPTNPIKTYRINYTTTGSGLSYSASGTSGYALSTASGSTTVNATSASTSTADTTRFTNFYPDCLYTFTISANNTTKNTSYGTTVSTTVTTTYLNPSPIFTINSTTELASAFSAKYTKKTANLVSDNSNKTNVYFGTSAGDWTCNAFTSIINSVSYRGNNTNASLSINATLGTGSTASVTYLGFPATKPTSSTNSALSLDTTTPTDWYSSYSGAYKGFYLKASNQVTIKAAALIPSSSQYTLTLTQTQAGGSSYDNSFPYYFDTYVTPTVSSFTTTIYPNTTPSIQICGIWILYGTAKLTATTVATNLGNYFYNSTKILQYSGSTVTNETGIANVTSTKTPTLVSPTTVTNTGAAVTYATTAYATSIPSITVTAYNAFDSTAAGTSTAINVIFDQPTYTLNNLFPTAINGATLNNTASCGMRVYSGTPLTSSYAPSYLFNTSPTETYYNNPFSHTWNLTSASISFNGKTYNGTQELLMANGAFRTSNTAYAKIYANNKYVFNNAVNDGASQFNYSSLGTTGYRYMTFAWKVSISDANTYAFLNIVLNNTSGISVNNNLIYGSDGTSKIILYYRFEDSTSLILPTVTTTGYIGTWWISANNSSTDDGSLTAGQYSAGQAYIIPSNYPWRPAGSLLNTLSSSTITSKIGIPITLTTGNTGSLYAYVRIGLPMANANSSVGSVQAYLTTT